MKKAPQNGNGNGNGKRKIYELKPSLYDELLARDEHTAALWLLISTQVVLFLGVHILWDSFLRGEPYLHLQFTLERFGSLWDMLNFFVYFEAPLLTCTFLFHPMLLLWAAIRRSCLAAVVDIFFLILLGATYISVIPITCYMCDKLAFQPFLRVTAAVESIRVCMKSYSFVRENAYKVLYPWHKDDDSGPAVWYAGQMSPTVASFSQYCYYLFSPALLYRDHYPRTKSIRWLKAASYLSHFCVTIWMTLIVVAEYLLPPSLKYQDVLRCFLSAAMFGLTGLMFGHVCAIHSWGNFTGELTRFGDRQFYSDWWNSTHFAEFYRKWNLLVHEYIHSYIYQDGRKFIPFKPLRLLLPFTISAFVHEYIISMGTGFFSPILIISFAVVGVVVFAWPVRGIKANWLLILGLSVGEGLMTWLYFLELKARKLCPEGSDVFGLRMIQCIAQSNQ